MDHDASRMAGNIPVVVQVNPHARNDDKTTAISNLTTLVGDLSNEESDDKDFTLENTP